MRGPRAVIFLILASIAAIAGCVSEQPATQEPESVVRAELVAPSVGTIQSVSPDGMKLLVADRSQICVQLLDGGEARCVAWDDPSGRSEVQLVGDWSDDAETFVFTLTEDSRPGLPVSPAVWLLDVREMSLDRVYESSEALFFDLAVSPNGEVIAVSGWLELGPPLQWGIFLLAEGSGPEPVPGVPEGLGDGRMVWVDANTLLATGSGPGEGVWRIDIDGGEAAAVLQRDPELGNPHLTAAGPDGERALVFWFDYAAATFFEVPGVSLYAVADLDSGEIMPLKDDDGTFLGPWHAAFSPDGSAIAYLYTAGSEQDGPVVLAWRNTAGGVENVLTDDLFGVVGERPPGPPRSSQQAMVWTESNRLVIVGATGALVVDLK